MSVCLLLTAFAAGSNPMAMPPPGWPAYPVPAYAGAYQMPMPPTYYPTSYVPQYGPPMPPPGPYGYQGYQPVSYGPPVSPMPMMGYASTAEPVYQGMASGGCYGGNCCMPYQGPPMYNTMEAPCWEGRKHRFFHRKDNCCEEDECGCDHCRCGLLSRLRNCFKHKKRDDDCCCAKPSCDVCQDSKPSLRERLKKCFHKDDECAACKPSLHDRLRECFHRSKKKENDCCASMSNGCASCSSGGCSSCQSPLTHFTPPTTMIPPAENPKAPKEIKEDKDPGARLPQGPPVHVIKEVPF